MLEPREEKLVRKYALAPAVALGAFLSVVATCGAWLLLVMVDDITYHTDDIYWPGIYLFGFFVVALTVLVVAALLTDRRRPYAPDWLDLCDRTLRAGPFAPNAGPDLPPRVVAQFHEVRIPSTAAVLLGLILLPPAMLLSLYLPHYRAGARRIEAQQQTTSAALETIRLGLENAGFAYTWCDDPYDYYSRYGYSVHGDLYDSDYDKEVSVVLEVNNAGQVSGVSYTVYVDLTQSNRENLDRAAAEVKTMNTALQDIPMDLAGGDLLTADLMPESFTEEFLEGSLYEDVHEWEDREDGTSLSAAYYTYPEEEYDEYSRSYFWFRVEYPEYTY